MDRAGEAGSAWMYRVVHIRLEQRQGGDRSQWDYIAETPQGKIFEGLETILNGHGAEGWDLVNILPTFWCSSEEAPTSTNVFGLRAIFKRAA